MIEIKKWTYWSRFHAVLLLPVMIVLQIVLLPAAPISMLCYYLICSRDNAWGGFTNKDILVSIFFILAMWYVFEWENECY